MVQINILDVNDNKPEFYRCGDSEGEPSCVKESHFTGEVLEESLGSIPIDMTVKDSDKVKKELHLSTRRRDAPLMYV